MDFRAVFLVWACGRGVALVAAAPLARPRAPCRPSGYPVGPLAWFRLFRQWCCRSIERLEFDLAFYTRRCQVFQKMVVTMTMTKDMVMVMGARHRHTATAVTVHHGQPPCDDDAWAPCARPSKQRGPRIEGEVALSSCARRGSGVAQRSRTLQEGTLKEGTLQEGTHHG